MSKVCKSIKIELDSELILMHFSKLKGDRG